MLSAVMKDNLKSFRSLYLSSSNLISLKDDQSAFIFFRSIWPLLRDFEGFLEWCFLSDIYFDEGSKEAVVIFNQELVKRFKLQRMTDLCGYSLCQDSLREASCLEDLTKGLMSLALHTRVKELIGERNELRIRKRG